MFVYIDDCYYGNVVSHDPSVQRNQNRFHCETVLIDRSCSKFRTNLTTTAMQCVVSGPLLVTLMEQMRSELDSNPPLPGSYTPKKGDLCAAKFSDGEW